MLKAHFIFVCVLVVVALVQSFNPITAAWSTIGYVGSMLYQALPLPCHYNECCHEGDGKWIPANITGLEESLNKSVYGQHLVQEIVVNAFRSHYRPNFQPNKALVLSFHGWPGGGKNYVTSFIVNNIFKQGFRSRYVHFYSGLINFPLQRDTDIYVMHLADWIRGNVSLCNRSVFIFDEVDKMHQRILDGVKPFIDHHTSIDGVDFRRTVFIFLSNSGGSIITKHMLQLWSEGKKREQLVLRDFEGLLRKNAYNDEGGFLKSNIIKGSLIDHYVPFLPLEEKHVRQCIADELERHNHTLDESIVTEVLKDLTFGPEPLNLFSIAGCKRIGQKVSNLVENKRYHWEL